MVRPLSRPAAETQGLQDEYGPDGFQALEILTGDYGDNPPDQDDLLEWEDISGLVTVPVLSDGSYEVWPYYEEDFYIPTVVHIGPDMKILSMDETYYDPSPWM